MGARELVAEAGQPLTRRRQQEHSGARSVALGA